MTTALFIVNDAPHGKERAPTALRLASEVAGKAGQNVHRQGGSRSRLCRLQGCHDIRALRIAEEYGDDLCREVLDTSVLAEVVGQGNRSRCLIDNLS